MVETVQPDPSKDEQVNLTADGQFEGSTDGQEKKRQSKNTPEERYGGGGSINN
jgi:hypothetical protein